MCSKPQLEFLTQLLLFNLTKQLTNNNKSDTSNDPNIFNFSAENPPLEPPTPPRTPIITSSQIDAQQRNATTPNDATRTNDQSNAHKSPQSINNDGEYGAASIPMSSSSRPSSPWSNVSQAAASTSSISVAPVSKLMGNDNSNVDRRSRTSSTNDAMVLRGDDNSDVDQEVDDDEEENSRAYDLSFQYNDDSMVSGSGEDQGSEGGTTINSFELAMARKDRSNDVSVF